MIHGVCVGGGLEVALMCDLRICGEGSRFGIPINRLGLTMGYGELAGLLAVVGPATALEILLEGRVFGAHEALDKGLVQRVVADERGRSRSRAPTAQRIAAGAPLVARWHKRSSAACARCQQLSARRDGTKATPASTPTTIAKDCARFWPSRRRASGDADGRRSPDSRCSSSRTSCRARPPACCSPIMGADVIKVENVPDGDDTRRFAPPEVNGEASAFMMMNRNKRGIALDLKQPAAKAALRRIVERVDVVIENFRVGTMDKLGLGLRGVAPDPTRRLIYCASPATA